jgi:hypothetical protein
MEAPLLLWQIAAVSEFEGGGYLTCEYDSSIEA